MQLNNLEEKDVEWPHDLNVKQNADQDASPDFRLVDTLPRSMFKT